MGQPAGSMEQWSFKVLTSHRRGHKVGLGYCLFWFGFLVDGISVDQTLDEYTKFGNLPSNIRFFYNTVPVSLCVLNNSYETNKTRQGHLKRPLIFLLSKAPSYK